jgi:hypothetical protein
MRLSYFFSLILLILNITCLSDNGQISANLPTIETFVAEPVIIENISIWIPAAKSGPFINRSCHTQENNVFSLVLPASVKHEKMPFCPVQTARILAELTAFYHSQSLPLTILNGWRWEYTYNCLFESVSYDLIRRGGCWEGCWEAVLNLSCGISSLQWLDIESLEKFSIKQLPSSESTIKVKTFSSMKTRDGYPKERQL